MPTISNSSPFNYYEITFRFPPATDDFSLYVTGDMDNISELSASAHGDESEAIWAVAEALVPVVSAGHGSTATVTGVKFYGSYREVEAPE
jgi:hypothetical protein